MLLQLHAALSQFYLGCLHWMYPFRLEVLTHTLEQPQ
jgi:hypothetical protein